MRSFTTFVVLILALTLTHPVQATRGLQRQDQDKRYALVIGNDAYRHVRTLEKADNDARAMGVALKKIGYQTTVLLDANERQMNGAVNRFVDNIAGGGQGVFFFAGHGVQINNQNFLLPIDVEDPQNETDVADQAVSLQGVQDKIAQARAQFALLVVDACRDNPLPKKAGRSIGGTRGLAPASSAQGQMVIFSAGARQQALDKLNDDDRNPNGVFTRELLPWLDKPGVSVRQAVLEVRRTVYAKAQSVNHEQVPAIYDQVLGDFYFVPSAATEVANLVPVATGLTAPDAGGVSLADLKKQQVERKKWEVWQARMQADYDDAFGFTGEPDLKIQAWELFLSNYPQKNPHSDEDDSLRAQAREQKQQAEVERQAAKRRPTRVTSRKPVTPASTRQAGQIIKDCSDCPEMVVIAAGSFQMGSEGAKDEKPAHSVSISPFALAKTEVTQGQWRAVMGSNPSYFSSCGNDCPVEQVSWDDAKEYLRKLSAKTGQSYRLPSEAEWEYACRAGGQHQYCGSDSEDDVAWIGKNSDDKPHTVGKKQANAWGLYDMSGNVWEWVEDLYHDSYAGAPTDGSAWTTGEGVARVLRGGSWFVIPDFARAAFRSRDATAGRDSVSGFRPARIVSP